MTPLLLPRIGEVPLLLPKETLVHRHHHHHQINGQVPARRAPSASRINGNTSQHQWTSTPLPPPALSPRCPPASMGGLSFF